jgi:hypothetical protein
MKIIFDLSFLKWFGYSWVQGLVLTLSVGFSFLFWIWNKNETRKGKATLLYLQIKEIENVIETVKKNCVNVTNIDGDKLIASKDILLNNNIWTENKNYFVTKISTDVYESIERFYENVEIISGNQKNIKEYMYAVLRNKLNKSNEIYFAGWINAWEIADGNSINQEKIFNDELFKISTKTDKFNQAALANIFLPSQFSNNFIMALNNYSKLSNSIAFLEIKKIAKIK